MEARDYQKQAIKSFEDNDYRGIFEMATGTGKTITSLFCSKKYFIEKQKIFLVILVPFTHLLFQWESNISLIFEKMPLICFGNKKKWKSKLYDKIRDYSYGISNIEIILTTYKTATSDFGKIIKEVKNNGFLIADECHYFGIKSLNHENFKNFVSRLGLSATPDRWWDKKGTDSLRNFFGETIYSYDLKKAIDNNNLTPYTYNIKPVYLTAQEEKEYLKYTKILVSLLNKKDSKEEVEKILLKRSNILSKAKNKIDCFIDEIRNKKLEKTLVYCPSGKIKEVTLKIAKLGLKVSRFDSTLNFKERKKIIKDFSENKIDVITAMKCLDEGVDIPSIERAYFISSTTNPREFIQRRGRILRKSKNKKKASIIDFIVVSSDELMESIMKKELPRFAEFSNYSLNKYQVRKEIIPYLENLNLEFLMDKLPWDVYKEYEKEEGIYYDE